MNETQQIDALQTVVEGYDQESLLPLLGKLIDFVISRSHEGHTDFSIEDFAAVILDG